MKSARNRLLIFFAVTLLLCLGIIVRLFFVHIVWGPELTKMAENQHNRLIIIPAKRGRILDANGDILALSFNIYSLWIEKSEINDFNQLCSDIKKVYDEFDVEKAKQLYDDSDERFIEIASELNRTNRDIVMSLKKRGLSAIANNKRYYPLSNLASHTVGIINADGLGITGIESSYNQYLKGTDGRYYLTTDVKGRQLAYGVEDRIEPVNGEDVQVTLINNIQYYVEEVLEEAYLEHRALMANAVVMNVNDGSIVAMASKPDFDLNHPRDIERYITKQDWDKLDIQSKTDFYFSKLWNNKIVSNTYEPGSVLKDIVAAIGIEEQVINFGSTFHCTGSKQVANYLLKCVSYPKGHGTQDLKTAFANSCNMSFIEIGRRIGTEKMYEYFRHLGLLTSAGIDLPAESSSIIVPEDKVGEVELATLSYGHGINITMLQLAKAVAATVNGGYNVTPHIFMSRTNEKGNVVSFSPPERERIFSEATSQAMREMLEFATTKGGGTHVAIPGFRVGGKSGTTLKITDGVYDEEKVVSSYVGIAPIDQPQYLVLVIIDEPQEEHYGSLVAAPVVKKILEHIYRFDIQKNIKDGEMIAAPDIIGATNDLLPEIEKQHDIHIVVKNPSDDPKKKVVSQFPEKGIMIKKGAKIIVQLEEK